MAENWGEEDEKSPIVSLLEKNQAVKQQSNSNPTHPTDREAERRRKIEHIEDINQYLRENSAVNTEVLYHSSMGKFLRVNPVKTNPLLVDDLGVRLNIHVRPEDKRFISETFTMSRRCVRRARLTRLGDLDALVADLTSRYKYCHGTPAEYRTELHRRLGKSELRHIMLAEYAGQIVIRSSKCRLVVDRNTEDENFHARQPRCQNCQKLTDHLIQKYIIPGLVKHDSKLNNSSEVKEEQENLDETVDQLQLHELSDEQSVLVAEPETEEVPENEDDELISAEAVDKNEDFSLTTSALEPHYSVDPNFPNDDLQQTYVDERNDKSTCKTIQRGKKRGSSAKGPPAKIKKLYCPKPECDLSFKALKTYKAHVASHSQDVVTELLPTKQEEDVKGLIVKGGHGRLNSLYKPGDRQCRECGRTFSSKQALINHTNLHSGRKNWLCTDCGKSFHSNSTMIDHKKRSHLGILNFPCDVCEKRFACPSEVTVHKRIHTGYRPYECSLCPNTFQRSTHLKRHVETMHINKGEGIKFKEETGDDISYLLQDNPVWVELIEDTTSIVESASERIAIIDACLANNQEQSSATAAVSTTVVGEVVVEQDTATSDDNQLIDDSVAAESFMVATVEDPDQMEESAAAAAAAKSIKVVCGNSAKLMSVKEYLKSEEVALKVRMENQANTKNNQ